MAPPSQRNGCLIKFDDDDDDNDDFSVETLHNSANVFKKSCGLLYALSTATPVPLSVVISSEIHASK